MTRFERDLAAGRALAGKNLATRRANLAAAMERASRGYVCQPKATAPKATAPKATAPKATAPKATA